MRSKKLLALVIILGLIKRFKPAGLLYQCYLTKLEKSFRISLKISRISIKVARGIQLTDFILRINYLEIKIKQCCLTFSIRGLSAKKTLNSIGFEIYGLSVNRREIYNDSSNKSTEAKSIVNWEKKVFSYLKPLLSYILIHKTKLNIFDLEANIVQTSFRSKKISLWNGQIELDLSVNKGKQILLQYNGNGQVDYENKKLILRVLNKIMPPAGSKFSFDEFEFILIQKKADDEISIEFEVSFVNIEIFDRRICSEKLRIADIYLYIELEANFEQIVITNNSGGSVGEVVFAFSFTHKVTENDILKIGLSVEVSQKLLTSFVAFQNIELEKIKVDGRLVLDFQMIFNISNPLQSYFGFKQLDNTLHITDLGNFDLSILKGDLNDILKSPLANENLSHRNLISEVTLEHIADNFLIAIVAAEDSSFYQHNGVNPESIGYAFAFNMAKKTFSRGASTITMQVVRNLFLNSDKNVVRKIEEILISLIIENHCNISKRRILEIYLNIIEFGHGIYGIDNASNFYFGKAPKYLSLTESIVLSYIVPRPKHFHDALIIKTPQLLANLPRYFNQLSRVLLFKKLINDDAYKGLSNEVVFANNLGTIVLQSSSA